MRFCESRNCCACSSIFDQNWQNYVGYILDTILSGSELYTAGKYQDATDYYAHRFAAVRFGCQS